MADAIEIGLTALRAHQRAIEVTGHNIANASTPGYSRQRVELTTPEPESVKPGMLGRGVQVLNIQRVTDDLLVERLRQAGTESSRLDALHKSLGDVEAAFNEPSDAGFATSIKNFFASLQSLANDPHSSAVREATVSEMQTFPRTLNSLASQLSALRDDLRNALPARLQEANALTAQIATLNQNITRETLGGNHANDLMDRREQLLNQLSNLISVDVRVDPRTQAATVALGGRLLVTSDSADTLVASADAQGNATVTFGDGVAAHISGGSVGALLQLHAKIIPGYQAQLDDIAAGIARAFNEAQATGTNADVHADGFLSDQIIDVAKIGMNLDDPAQASAGKTGIPSAIAPSFTDANGVSQVRDLTINIVDNATGVAVKHILRYDPGSGAVPASRSLADLVQAINSGRGGGFSVYPPDAGVTGLTASIIPTDGGVRLGLAAATGMSVDFSRALDTQPATAAWTSPAVTVAGGDAAQAGKRFEFDVVAGGIAVTWRDANGTSHPYPAVGPNTAPIGAVTVLGGLTIDTTAAGAFHVGDHFTVDLDAAGAVPAGAGATPTWTAGSAAMTISGRYTGGMAFDPTQPWSMRVLQSGTVGAAAGAVPPPPMVQFTYWSTDGGVASSHTVTKTLDGSLPTGTPIAIADGVFATFGAGTLTAGDQVGVVVDGQPDQAGLLPALGIDAMFTGSDARTLAVSQHLVDDPNRFATGWTRSPGDNANVQSLIAVRDGKVLANGQDTIESGYQAMVSDVGVQVDQAKRLSQNQDVVVQTLSNRRSDTSGVSIDEEVGNLILEQQAYAAAAKLVTAARENIQTLMQLLG